MYLLRRANRNVMNADGYNWTEVACQVNFCSCKIVEKKGFFVKVSNMKCHPKFNL